MNFPLFTGCATALITPFLPDGRLDEPALRRLLAMQIAAKMDALVLLGTTGEPCTLSMDERERIIEIGLECTGGSIPVIVGTGSNDTRRAIEYARQAQRLGAAGQLSVTPYYNKTTQSGLIRHYHAILDACPLPMILYNVPGRTGIGIKPATYKVLSKHPNINGVKEASGNIAEFALTRSICGDDLVFWSGNDSDTVPMMALGAVGVISVASNIIPKDVAKLCELGLAGDFKAAAAEYFRLADFFDKLFIETNPIPVKTAMNVAGMNVGKLRLPLVDMDPANLEKLKVSMRGVGLKV